MTKIHNGNLFNFVSINSQLNYIYVWGGTVNIIYILACSCKKRLWFEHKIDQF